MNIVQAYKTSKGLFLSQEEANKKINRVLIPVNRPGEAQEREIVQSVYLLSFDGKYAELNLVTVI